MEERREKRKKEMDGESEREKKREMRRNRKTERNRAKETSAKITKTLTENWLHKELTCLIVACILTWLYMSIRKLAVLMSHRVLRKRVSDANERR